MLHRNKRFNTDGSDSSTYASVRHNGYYTASVSPGRQQSISHTYSVLFDDWMPASRRIFAGDYAIEIFDIPHTRCAPEELDYIILAPLKWGSSRWRQPTARLDLAVISGR
jgi:hypothetical protein